MVQTVEAKLEQLAAANQAKLGALAETSRPAPAFGPSAPVNVPVQEDLKQTEPALMQSHYR